MAGPLGSGRWWSAAGTGATAGSSAYETEFLGMGVVGIFAFGCDGECRSRRHHPPAVESQFGYSHSASGADVDADAGTFPGVLHLLIVGIFDRPPFGPITVDRCDGDAPPHV